MKNKYTGVKESKRINIILLLNLKNINEKRKYNHWVGNVFVSYND